MELSKKIEGFLDVMDRPSIHTLVEWCNQARKLEAKLAQLEKDCEPFRAQITQRKTYKINEPMDVRYQEDQA